MIICRELIHNRKEMINSLTTKSNIFNVIIMKKQLFFNLLFACSLTTLTAQTPVYLDDTQPIEARVKDPQPL